MEKACGINPPQVLMMASLRAPGLCPRQITERKTNPGDSDGIEFGREIPVAASAGQPQQTYSAMLRLCGSSEGCGPVAAFGKLQNAIFEPRGKFQE